MSSQGRPPQRPRFAPAAKKPPRFTGLGTRSIETPPRFAPAAKPETPGDTPPRFAQAVGATVVPKPKPKPKPEPRNRIGHPDDRSPLTNRELRADRASYALQAMVFLRAMEFDMRTAPPTKLVQPRVHMDDLLTQHQEPDGIHSCVNTSQLNAMLWQGQITPAVGAAVNQSLVETLRTYFTPADQAQVTDIGIRYQAGSPQIAEHFDEVVPDADFLHLPIALARTAAGSPSMFDILISEINRGSVAVANKPDHTVLVVGYSELDLTNPGTTNLIVSDPLRPGQLERQQYSAFRGVSSIMPQLDDPLRGKTAAIR